jgi:tetratricopeptide (TPR) repeat protein/predicted Ser/Thr protein kinase
MAGDDGTSLGETLVDTPPPGDSEELPRGTTIRRYVVLDHIGSGAMGDVYSAYDFALDRRVALKLVRDPRRRAPHRRLEREAQALARLSHPNVVTVYDVGSYQDRVFVAMELVEGETLGQWLAAAPRPASEIIDVFRRAGEGLAAAHAAGIVHRDFKPDNVLLDRTGRVLVGDFGLALIEQDADLEPDGASGPSGVSLTLTGAAVGTPAYMAPEQNAASSAIDARADQFSFCVALFEALCGERPFAGETAAEVAEAVASGQVREPARPPPARLRKLLLRGLSVDPADRHPSMDQLLAGLRRDPSRPRWLALGAVAAVLGGAAVIGLGAVKSAAEPPCQDAARKLDGVWDRGRRQALVAAFRAAGADPAQVEARLDRYAGSWVAMHTESCRATRVTGEQSEALLDRRMQCLDRRRAELGALVEVMVTPDQKTLARAVKAADALAPLDGCADAQALLEEQPPPDPDKRARAVALHDRQAAIRASFNTGHYREALDQALPLAEDARALGYRPVEAEALLTLARLQWANGDIATAEDTLYQTIAAGEAGRAGAVTVDAWLHLVWIVGEEQARYTDAMRLAAVARGALERMGGNRRLESVLEDHLGVLHFNKGDHAAARPRLERSLALREALYGPDDLELSATLQHLALLEQAEDRMDRALELHRRARRIAEKAQGPEHLEVIMFLGGEAAVLYEIGRLEEAYALFQRGLEVLARRGRSDSAVAGSFLTNIGLIHARQGRVDEARRSQERALAIYEKVFGPDNPHTGVALLNLGQALAGLKRHGEAIAQYERAAAIFRAKGGEAHLDLALAWDGLGEVHLARGDAAAAIEVLERSLAIREKAGGPSRDAALTRMRLATALHRTRREPERARRLADEARARFDEAGATAEAAEAAALAAAIR